MRRVLTSLTAMAIAIALTGCQSPTTGRIAASDAVFFGKVQWSAEELAKPIAAREIRRNSYASHAVVRLAGPEKPHVHDQHELTVFILSGRARIHVADQVHDLKPGDVVQIPHGLTHWAVPVGPDPAEAYVVFTPPFDGKDKRLVDP